MKRRRGGWLWVGMLALGACAPAAAYRVDLLEPGFDGTRTYRMVGNVLAARGTAAPLELNLERIERRGQPARLFLRAEYSGSDWLGIRDGESLLVVADADSIRLAAEGSAERRVLRGSQPVETRRYPVEPAQLRRVAEARGVQVVVRGARVSESRSFSPENFTRLRDFLREHPDSAGSPPAAPAPTPAPAPPTGSRGR